MSPASYLTAPPRVAARSIATGETSTNVKARHPNASYVARKPASGEVEMPQEGQALVSLALAGLGLLAAALAVGASGAGGTFVEPDVHVLTSWTRTGPLRRLVLRLGGERARRRRRRRRQGGDRRRAPQRRRLLDRNDVRLLGPDRPPDLPLRRRGRRRERLLHGRRGRHEPRSRARHPRRVARQRRRARRPLLGSHRGAATPLRRRRRPATHSAGASRARAT